MKRETSKMRSSVSLRGVSRLAVLQGLSLEKLAPLVPELVLLLFFYAAGILLPWWGLLIPAIIAGGIELGTVRRLKPLRIAIVGALSWLSVAFVQDVVTWGRLSSRIAAVIGFPSLFAAYAVTGLLAFIVVWLGATVGQLIRRGTEAQKLNKSAHVVF